MFKHDKNLICPLCNGLEASSLPCPKCGGSMDDQGNIENYYGPYSPLPGKRFIYVSAGNRKPRTR